MPDKTGLSHLGMSAMSSAAEGITIARITEPDQPLVFVNEGFAKMTGYSVEETLRKNCRFLQGPDTDRATVASIRNAISTGQKITVELLNYTKTKQPFWNRLTVAPIAQEAGGPAEYYVGVQFDVTDYKIMQKKVQHYADQMKRINTEAEKGIRTLTETMMNNSSESMKSIQLLAAKLNHEKHGDIVESVQEVQQSLNTLNQTISGLKVVMENCGGISGFVHVDPVTLEIRDDKEAA